MALIARKAICNTASPLIQIKRFRGKINIQRPRPPHFERAKYLALTKPWFLKQKERTPEDLCQNLKIQVKENKPDNIFQKFIATELHQWFSKSKLIAFCHFNPMTSEQQFKAYVMFRQEKMHFKQYGKETLEMAIKGTPYEAVLDFYVSQNMTIFSPEPEIKKMLRILKKFPQLVLYAGIYENKLISKDELIYYSTIPTIEAAQSGLVHTLNSAGSQLVNNLTTHQTNLVSHLEERAKQFLFSFKL